jgi:hypothetical protein
MIASQRKDDTMRVTLIKSEDWERLIDTDTGDTLAENHTLSAEDTLLAIHYTGALNEVCIQEIDGDKVLVTRREKRY